MNTNTLEELGLSNAEAKIYLALLEEGPSKTGKIIDTTKLQSSTVYHVLGALVEKGLVSYIHKGKNKHYQAAKPETFLTFLNEKKRKFEEILPELKEKEEKSKQKESAKIYQGINGLKAAFNDILTSLKKNDTYYFFQVRTEDLKEQNIKTFLRNYHLKRAEKGIKVKGLAHNNVKQVVSEIFKGIANSNIRYLNELTPTGIIIYQNKVMTLDFSTPTIFVIESNTISNSYKNYFEEKWKIAK